MAAPDLTPYLDLRVFDKDSQQIIDAALLDLKTKLPEWVPREGNMEMLLLEAMGLEVSEAVAAINRLPSAVVEILFRLLGIDRFGGTQPSTTVTFQLADALGHEIPAGARVSLELGSGLEPVIFTTTNALSVAAAATSGTVAALGDRYTYEANGIVAGTPVELLDSISFVNSASLGSLVAFGADPETDIAWFDRGIKRFARLSETLSVPSQFVYAALEHPEVIRAFGIDNYDPAVGPVGSNLGHMTVAVYGDHSMLSAPFKVTLDTELEAAAQANLAVHIIDPTITTVAVTVEIVKNTQYTDATTIARITAVLQQYLDQDFWDWSTVVRRNSLIALIGSDLSVAYVSAMIVPAADVNLAGAAPLTTRGAVTVTILNTGGGTL